MDIDHDIFDHYDNLELYRPATVLIHGLRYDVDDSTNQACFYIQDIEETSQCFQNYPTKFLWQSKKTYVTLFDESHLPYNSIKRDFRRTFKRRIKGSGEGNRYLVQEQIIHNLKHDTNESIHIRECTWRSQAINTEDKYILVTLARDDSYNKDVAQSFMHKTPSYGVNIMHDDLVDDGDNFVFTNNILPGALAQLTYFTEKLIHIDQVRNKNSSICTPSEESDETDEDLFEANQLNVNVSFDPAVMWVTPYEEKRGLQTSLFQLSEKFGDTYESHVYKMTTSGRYRSDLSLSMSEVKEYNKYMSDRNDLEESFKGIPGDAIVVDAIKNKNKNGIASDNEEFEELELSMPEIVDHNYNTSTPSQGKIIPTIRINDNAAYRKSHFRNAGLKQRLASSDGICLLEDDTKNTQQYRTSERRTPDTAQRTPNINIRTNSDIINSRKRKNDITTNVHTDEYQSFADAIDCSEDVIQYVDKHSESNSVDINGQTNYFKREDNDNNNEEVADYINGKYGINNCNCEIQPSDQQVSCDNADDSDIDTDTSSRKKKSSLLEMSRNAELKLQDVVDGIPIVNPQAHSENIHDNGDQNNIQLYDVYANEPLAHHLSKRDYKNDNGESTNNYQLINTNNNICTCYYEEFDDEHTDDSSHINDDYNHQPRWIYPKDDEKSESECEFMSPKDTTPEVTDEKNVEQEVLLDLNTFIIPPKDSPLNNIMKVNCENESDSGFENHHVHEIISSEKHQKNHINNSENDLVISLSSSEDDFQNINYPKQTDKQFDSRIDDKKHPTLKFKAPVDQIEDVGVHTDMNSFITSVQSLLNKHWVIEKPDESGDFTIQRRLTDSPDTSTSFTKRRSLLDISKGHKTKYNSTTQSSSDEDEQVKRVSDYLKSKRNLPNNDFDVGVKRTADMKSFVAAVKYKPNNHYFIKHPENNTDDDLTNIQEPPKTTSITRKKSDSIISLESEDEYLQLPSGNNKLKNDKFNNILTNSYEVCSEEDIVDVESELESFISSINKLSLNKLRIESPNFESVIDYKKNKDGRMKKKRSLLDMATQHKSVLSSSDEEDAYKSRGINVIDNRSKYTSDYDVNIKAETDMPSFVKAIKNIKTTSLRHIQGPEGELEVPTYASLISENESLRGFVDLPRPKHLSDRNQMLKQIPSPLKPSTISELKSDMSTVLSPQDKQKILSPQDIDDKQKVLSPQIIDNKQKILSPQDIDNKQKILSPQDKDNKQKVLYPQDTDNNQKVLSPQDKYDKQKISIPQYKDDKQKVLSPQYGDNKQEVLSPQYQDDNQEVLAPQYKDDNQKIRKKVTPGISSKFSSDMDEVRTHQFNNDEDFSPSCNDHLSHDKTATYPQNTRCIDHTNRDHGNNKSDLIYVNIDIPQEMAEKDSDFVYVNVPITEVEATTHEEETFVNILSPINGKEERSMSLSSEWDDVFQTGNTTPTNEDETVPQFRDSYTQSCANYEINETNDTDVVLDMKSYIMSARDLSSNDLTTENPIREIGFDYVSVLRQHIDIGTSTRESPDIDSTNENTRKRKRETRESDYQTNSHTRDKTPRDQQLKLHYQHSDSSGHQTCQRRDSHDHHLNTRDYNSSSASSVMRMSELFGSTATPTSLNGHSINNNKSVHSNKNSSSKVVNSSKVVMCNKVANSNTVVNNDRVALSSKVVNGNKVVNSNKVINSNKVVTSNKVVNCNKVVNNNNKAVSSFKDNEKTLKKTTPHEDRKDGDNSHVKTKSFKNTHEEAKKVGEWVISKNNTEENSEKTDENIPQKTYIDLIDGIDFRSNPDKSKTTYLKTQLSKTKKQKGFTLKKDNVGINSGHTYSSKHVSENNTLSTPSLTNVTNMNVKVEYKPHQLKYGASEDVDHVIVLPNGKIFTTTEDNEYSETDEKNTETLVEIKNLKNNSKPLPPSVISNLNVDICSDNKNYYLVDDQPKPETIESKCYHIQEDEKPKDDFESKSYILLEGISNDNENGTFNWYIDDESNEKRDEHENIDDRRISEDKQRSFKHTKEIYEQNINKDNTKQLKTKQQNNDNVTLDKPISTTQNDYRNELEYDSNAMDTRSSLSIQHSNVKQSVQYLITNVGNKLVDSTDNHGNNDDINNKLHITVRDSLFPTDSPKSPTTAYSPKSPSKTNDCRSVLCVRSEPRQKNASTPQGEDINFFHPYQEEEENISIYDVKQLSCSNTGTLGKHSKSWDRGLNSTHRVSRNYDLSTSAYDLTSRDEDDSHDFDLNPSREDSRNHGLSASAYELNSGNHDFNTHCFDFNPSDFYFNSRDLEESHIEDDREEYRERSDSSDSSYRDRRFGIFNSSPNYEKNQVRRALGNDYYNYGRGKLYGSLDCLYPSNYRGVSRSHTLEADKRRRLFAGYSYLSLGSLPPDHEIVRASSRESRAKELEIELNFIRNERRKAREEREFDFYYDQSKPKRNVKHIVIPEVFENN